MGAVIEEDKIPTTELFKAYCDKFKLDAIHLSLHVGEDYVLLGTVPEKSAARLEKALITEGCDFYPIGNTVAGAGLKLKFQDGTIEVIGASGWDHFR